MHFFANWKGLTVAHKRYQQQKTNVAARVAIVGVAACALVASIGMGVASGVAGVPEGVDTFGIAEQRALTSESSSLATSASDTAVVETTSLQSTAPRDISAGIADIEAEEEAARIAAEEAARAEEEARIAAAEEARAAQAEVVQQESVAVAEDTSSLSEVDWSVGKDAFVAEWTARIDAYLAGSALAGQGATFALAAWENGVDPRFSPAISNTESSKGGSCFLPYNAWGWGESGWSSWTDAINAHVAGLGANYGYSLTLENAAKYCPPHATDWYNKTLAQMQLI